MTGTATFEPGQNLQFLPGASLSEQPTSSSSGIYLQSTDSLTTRLFSLSNGSSIGMRMAGGGLRLNNGGGFVLAPVNLPAFFRAFVDSHQQAAVLTWEPRPRIAEVVIEKRLAGHILTSEGLPQRTLWSGWSWPPSISITEPSATPEYRIPVFTNTGSAAVALVAFRNTAN